VSKNEGSNDLQLLEELAQVAQAPLQLALLLLHHPGDRPAGLVLLKELQQTLIPSDSAGVQHAHTHAHTNHQQTHTFRRCREGSDTHTHTVRCSSHLLELVLVHRKFLQNGIKQVYRWTQGQTAVKLLTKGNSSVKLQSICVSCMRVISKQTKGDRKQTLRDSGSLQVLRPCCLTSPTAQLKQAHMDAQTDMQTDREQQEADLE